MKLYRSRTNVILGGVCAGLADYLGLDATIVRIFFVILSTASGFGFPLYLVLWVILPRQEEVPGDIGQRMGSIGQEIGEAVRRQNPQKGMYIGLALIMAGIFFLLESLNLPWLRWFNPDLIWPLLIIAGGAALLIRGLKGDQ
jgi:phage shock protein PspC (stress-responsive transcriptional regulator)